MVHAWLTVEPTAADFIKVVQNNQHEPQEQPKRRPESKLETVVTDPSHHEEPPTSEPVVDLNEETPEELAQDVILNNLATLYSLLMDSCLVPSSLDEIHLLLTLLSCDEAKPLAYPTLLGETFRSVARCRFFAKNGAPKAEVSVDPYGPMRTPTGRLCHLDGYPTGIDKES